MARDSRAVGILAYFARHRTAANLVMLIMVVAGFATIPQMRSQFYPDVIIEEVSVSVVWPGAGAEDVDSAVVQVLEPALLAVEGVVESGARATEGRAVIDLGFEPGWNMTRAAEDVQSAVAAAGTLPDGAEEPVVRRSNWRDRVTDVVITGPVSVDQLGRFADEFVVRLFAEGISRTTIQGVAAPQTVVEVTSAALIRHDVTMAEIARAIGAEAAADPAGELGDGAARLRTGIAKRSAEEIAAVVLRNDPGGAKLTVGDVAEVRVEGIDRSRAAFVGDNPAITVRVDRNDQGDAIGIQATVEKVTADLQTTLPDGVTMDLIRSRAEDISARLTLLLDNELTGLGLVLLLLFLFLNARTAFWVAAGIPVSLLAALAAMHLMGLTINMISIFALIITVGIVVDDAIVVGEHADYRVRTLGETPQQAAERSAIRMAGPVFSATVTTVIAFLGLTALSGQFGGLILDIPLTVLAVLVASMIESFIIMPNHMAHALEDSARPRWYDLPSRTSNRGLDWFRLWLFRPLMRAVVWARYPVVAAAVLLWCLMAAAFIRGDVQWRFFNAPEEGSVSGNFSMLPGADRDDTMAMMREVQRAVAELGARYETEFGLNPVDYAIAEVGGSSGRGLSGADAKDPSLLGSIAIELIDPDLRPYSSSEFVSALQEAVRPVPMLEELSFRGFRSGPGGDSLSVRLYGASTERLKQAAEGLKQALAIYPEVSGLEDSLAYDKDEMVLELTPQGKALGFTIDALGLDLRNRLNGIEAAAYPDGPRSATIRVELRPDERRADFLDNTLLRSPAGQYVPLADIVTVQTKSSFSTVRRENGLRLVTVSGDLSEDDPARAAEVSARLADTILPAIESEYGVATEQSGLAEQEDTFLNDALFGFLLSLLGIYLVLAWMFASWMRPLVVMSVIPFGAVGVIWGHWVWDVPLSMFTVVAMIGMSGIIINDSIVLVSTVDEYTPRRGLHRAIIDGATDRLRPILLTTLTTVLGIAPLLYEDSSQAAFLKPSVITLVYGLGFGMFIVLLVVPAVMAIQFDVSRHIASARRALWSRHPAQRLRGISRGVALAMAGLFAATLGPAMLTGRLPGPVASRLPEGVSVMPLALALFVAGAALLALLGYVFGAVVLRRRAG